MASVMIMLNSIEIQEAPSWQCVAFTLQQRVILRWDLLAAAGTKPIRVACPLCGVTYACADGSVGDTLKRSGLSGWVGGLAKLATQDAKRLRRIPAKLDAEERVLLDLTEL
eukprot:5822-Heterococcus_DN1.PRE.1